ncbi:hypothetical protein H4K35_06165 [Myroides sp. NP-2]|uniref:hypothetical protein n=1 Tax=Myroides sp. NP-2 TaxID=2759945 RepID=UPI0015FB42DA|nr:hypothetical protein [Myroides sp. NP-2]MBB1149718.1 hypothetical protein [Myroides sp. NP-2]
MYSTFLNTSIRYGILPLLALFCSCQQKFETTDYSAHFSGEIQNPTANYILFFKDNMLLDTIFLDENNHFEKKFDSLSPGLYIYRINPEFQYVYFDKNDSLHLRLNSRDFDHSIIYSGRGSEKNNFLMNLTVKNLVDESTRYENYDLGVNQFMRFIDSTHAARTTYYLRSKAIVDWGPEFDLYAKTKLDLHFYSQKEIYPIAHYVRTKEDIRDQLPTDYYSFRNKVDFNNEKLIRYSSFTKYLAIMLSSISDESDLDFDSQTKFDKNITKLNVVDTLIRNEKVKNTILDNIALIYLLEDQNLNNNDKFFERYFKLSTDTTQHQEIIKIQTAVQNLKYENRLPKVELVDLEEQAVDFKKLIRKKTLMFVWTKNGLAHANASHKRALELLEKLPDIQVISVCIDGEHDEWRDLVSEYKHPNLIELRCVDFNDMKDKWIITKIQRSFILHADGSIQEAFVNIFDRNMEKLLAL